MEIVLAKTAGFCFGVSNAIKMIFNLLENADEKIYTLGPIIHNRQMVEYLESFGVTVIEKTDSVKPPAYILIRAHGIPYNIYKDIENKGFVPVDATCPYVKKIHNLVRDKYNKGYKIIIVGDEKHPEIIGINGWCNNEALIINSESVLNKIPNSDEKVFVVVQTTFNHTKWLSIVKLLENKFINMEKCDTICSATINRQKEAEELSKTVDVMFVIGGKESSNTQKLFEICKNNCCRTYNIETPGDLLPVNIKEIKRVGITAGASTPDWIIKEVLNKMDELNKQDELNVLEKPEKQAETIEEQTRDIVEEESAKQEDLKEQENEQEELNKQEKEEVNLEKEEEANLQEKEEDNSQEVEEADSLKEEVELKEKEEVDLEEKEEVNFEEAVEDSMVTLRTGDIVKGKVISVGSNEIFVDLGYKCDGVIPFEELPDDLVPSEHYNPSMEIDVYVVKVNDGEGNVLLSQKKVNIIHGWNIIGKAYKEKEPVKAKVVEVIKGGLLATTNNIRVFIPASQISDRFITNFNEFLKQEVDIRIIEFNRTKNKVVGSRRVLIEEEKKILSNELWSGIEVDKTYIGKVKNLTKFGAFVDIGGVDGLIHLSELSWHKIKHPSEVVTVGDEVEVVVLDFDREKERISLGYKKAEDNPWVKISEKYNVGDIITGKVVRLVPFGCFVEIDKGIDGLVHISQISNKRIAKPDDVLKVGQEIEAKIVEMDLESKKIGLSIKEVNPIDPVDSIEENIEFKKEHKRPRNHPKQTKREENSPFEHKEELTVTLGEVLGHINFDTD